jgi:hypothetical protein
MSVGARRTAGGSGSGVGAGAGRGTGTGTGKAAVFRYGATDGDSDLREVDGVFAMLHECPSSPKWATFRETVA